MGGRNSGRLTECEGGAEGHRPAQRHVGGVAGGVLVHSEGGVDARAVDVLALLIQATHRGPARDKMCRAQRFSPAMVNVRERQGV